MQPYKNPATDEPKVPIEQLFDLSGDQTDPSMLYSTLSLPTAPSHRPYVIVNMVSTVDGKTLIAPRGNTARGVGGLTDQVLMRRLEKAVDAIMVGSGTVRASNLIYPVDKWRITVTKSGNLPLQNRFFTDSPGRVVVIATNMSESERKQLVTMGCNVISKDLVSPCEPDLKSALSYFRNKLGIQHLLCEGGPTLNDEFFRNGWVDELFHSIAPKIKGGSDIPTIVAGTGFPDRSYVRLELISIYRDGDELYCRYRVGEVEEAA